MYKETIKSNLFDIAKRDENNMYFYPNNSYRIIGIILPFFFSFLAIVFFVLMDFEFNRYLVMYIAFYVVFCLVLVLLSFDYVRITGQNVIVKKLLSKQEFRIHDIKNIVRETKRVSMYHRYGRHTVRVVSFSFELQNSSRVVFLKSIIENNIDKYDDSLEHKLDEFVKILHSDYNLTILFRDIDYEKKDGFNVKADYVKRRLRLDPTVDRREELKEIEARNEEKRKRKKSTIKTFILFSFILSIGAAMRLSKGIDFVGVILAIFALILVHSVYELTR